MVNNENRYQYKIWNRRLEFKLWTKLVKFHFKLIPFGKAWILLFFPQLWVNNWLAVFLELVRQPAMKKENWIQTSCILLENIHILSHPTHGKRIGLIYTRVGWKVLRLTKVQSWDMTKWGLFFQHSPLCVSHASSIDVAMLGKKSSTADKASSYELFSPGVFQFTLILWWQINCSFI